MRELYKYIIVDEDTEAVIDKCNSSELAQAIAKNYPGKNVSVYKRFNTIKKGK